MESRPSAQSGCFVPAALAQLPICDAVYTRILSSDDPSSNSSTLQVDLNEMKYILGQVVDVEDDDVVDSRRISSTGNDDDENEVRAKDAREATCGDLHACYSLGIILS